MIDKDAEDQREDYLNRSVNSGEETQERVEQGDFPLWERLSEVRLEEAHREQVRFLGGGAKDWTCKE